jgi:hypothetical protein
LAGEKKPKVLILVEEEIQSPHYIKGDLGDLRVSPRTACQGWRRNSKSPLRVEKKSKVPLLRGL